MQQIALLPVDSVSITILVDNVFDVLLTDQGPAKRPAFGPRMPLVPTTTLEGGLAPDFSWHSTAFRLCLRSPGTDKSTESSSIRGRPPMALWRTCGGWSWTPATSRPSCSAMATSTTPRGWTGS